MWTFSKIHLILSSKIYNVSFDFRHIGKGCDRDTYSVQSQRKLCGASPSAIDLLPTPGVGAEWTKPLISDEGHESDQMFEFDGKNDKLWIIALYFCLKKPIPIFQFLCFFLQDLALQFQYPALFWITIYQVFSQLQRGYDMDNIKGKTNTWRSISYVPLMTIVSTCIDNLMK